MVASRPRVLFLLTLGCGFFDSGKNLIGGVGRKCPASSALKTELLAIFEACLFAKSKLFQSLTIFSDSLEAIKLCALDLAPPWDVRLLIRDIKDGCSGLNLKFRHVGRAKNRVAHWVASKAARDSLPLDWVSLHALYFDSALASMF